MDEKKLNKNKFKKYLKFIILGVSIFIASVIVIINYKQSYVALTVIPSVLLAFLQSNEKQEKLAGMQIEKFEKEQKEERFKKMLKFVFRTYLNNDKKAIAMFEEINCKLGRYCTQEELDDGPPGYEHLMDLRLLTFGYYTDDRGLLVHISSPNDHCRYDAAEKEQEFYKCLKKCAFGKNELYIDILRRELPKILNDDTFDFDKETLKSNS